MKPVLVAGVAIVNLALIFYTIFIINEHKKKAAHRNVVLFITLGLIFDITATICMIIGSEKSPFSLHGILGYSSLTGMFLDAVLIWKHKLKFNSDKPFAQSLNIYSKAAYTWWILAYITGAIIISRG